MPAPQKYPTPAQAMRQRLAEALEFGAAFDLAWGDAFGTIRYPHALDERRDWEDALIATRPAWKAAYQQKLDCHERVFSALNPHNGSIDLQAVA